MRRKSPRAQQGVPTMADVAVAAGVSLMTVSRVINGEKNVRASTRDAVLDAIGKLDYTPNQAARTLAGAEPIRIGLLYSNPSAAYLSRFLLGSLERARHHHVQLLIEKSDTEVAEAEAAVRDLLASGVDGMILSPPLCDSQVLLDLIAATGTLAVVVANWQPAGVSTVRIDDREAGAAMTRHLLLLGHTRIGFIAGNPAHKASEQRLLGFKGAMAAAGVALPDELVAQGAFTYRSGLAAAAALLDLCERPTAIFASNDDMAAATVAFAHRRQLEVPTDLTVCGFDDTDFAQSIWPELTTIHQPIAAMSRTAVDMLVGQIRARRAGHDVPVQDSLLDFTLVRRQSDASPAGGV